MKMIASMGQLYKAIVEEKQFGVGKPGERLKVLTEAFLNTALGEIMERLDMPGKSGLMNKGNSVINGVCRCICEPRGDNGLEGYQVGEAYRYRKMIGPDQRCFYKVYPSKEQADYCEACGPNVFKRFFEEV